MTHARAIIADDEPLLRAELADALAQWWPSLELVDQLGDGSSAVASAMRHEPDIVFLDINMPRLDGLSAAQQLRKLGYAGEIVFITAYDQHALQAFTHRATDYLVKPLEADRLQETIARLKARLATPVHTAQTQAWIDELRQAIARWPAPTAPVEPLAEPAGAEHGAAWLKVVKGNRMELLAVDDVACFQAVPGYTLARTRSDEHLINEPLSKLVERLDPQQFVQVHRSSVVNLRYVAGIQRERPGRYRVELKHGLGTLDVSRSRAEVFRDL